MTECSPPAEISVRSLSYISFAVLLLSAPTGIAQNAPETLPAPVVPQVAISRDCADFSGSKSFAIVEGMQRSQYMLSSNIPSDQMLRCGGRLVSVGLQLDNVDEQVKSELFTSETNTDMRGMKASIFGGGDSVRFGVVLEHAGSESRSELRIPGTEFSKETVSGVTQSMRLETATRWGRINAGLSLLYLSSKTDREIPVARTMVTTGGRRLNVFQPGASIAWKSDQTQLTVLRNQASEVDRDGDRLKLPWTNALRIVHLLEQGQGIRSQFERTGNSESASTATNAGLIAYFVKIDDVTIDLGWLGRTSSYRVKEEATADQLTTFGISAVAIWQYATNADVNVGLHSLSGNNALGGPEKRTAHRLITGGDLGIQVSF